MSQVPDLNCHAFQYELYANYRRLREVDPVHVSLFFGQPRVALLRHDHVLAAFKDDRFGTLRIPILENLMESENPEVAVLGRVLANILIIKDPPDHTRLRGLVSKAFTPRAVERLRTRIEQVVPDLLDASASRGGMDLIAGFAAPLPAIVIAELLGVPPDDRDDLKRWSGDFAPIIDRTLNVAGLLPAARGAALLSEYLRRIIAERRVEPREDLISDLLAAKEGSDALSEDELVATCILILVAGQETTTNLLGNGTLTLLRHPDQLEHLRGHPEDLPRAVEELLRFESPVQRFMRQPHEDVEVGGVKIPKGVIVDLVIGAANRDPAEFRRPDELDVERAENRHLAFGLGRHFCLGATLARLEARIAFRELLERSPRLRLRKDPEWKPGSFLRGLHSLELAF